jgi:hypothetical protein
MELEARRPYRRNAARSGDAPDLPTQLEELLNEVWIQESFERKHPFTCGVIREVYQSRRREGDRAVDRSARTTST